MTQISPLDVAGRYSYLGMSVVGVVTCTIAYPDSSPVEKKYNGWYIASCIIGIAVGVAWLDDKTKAARLTRLGDQACYGCVIIADAFRAPDEWTRSGVRTGATVGESIGAFLVITLGHSRVTQFFTFAVPIVRIAESYVPKPTECENQD